MSKVKLSFGLEFISSRWVILSNRCQLVGRAMEYILQTQYFSRILLFLVMLVYVMACLSLSIPLSDIFPTCRF